VPAGKPFIVETCPVFKMSISDYNLLLLDTDNRMIAPFWC
jgi:hypothetical protein